MFLTEEYYLVYFSRFLDLMCIHCDVPGSNLSEHAWFYVVSKPLFTRSS